ncbi:DEAD-box ATP-dependent RNA helicase 41 [Striga hermonthica]|uniref:DEAD-box ATP-dependent RNA helicase 41 n=1 Tax=Striga hermonthica TaxID=68872 RepID=A0A9N7RKJ9_STRHE|nr:DEAD-box ATP-dependent RNA helicase 41 [Striga hermonthica]
MAADENQSTEDDVKQRCWDQREALPGEPICAVCGRYGEYICDETDDDVCSLECKKTLLTRLAKKSQPSSLKAPSVRLPAKDECYYVREDSKSESRSMTDTQAQALREKLEISVQGDNAPAPALSFSSCDLPEKLVQNLEASGYEIPTPVQMQAIPCALTGQSVLVSAETGSGKTCSFLVPIISHCTKTKSNLQKPMALVLTPTRELSVQVEEQAKSLGKGLPFKTALVVGGDAIARQVYRIKNGVSMIVGTPGRLVDLLTKHDFDLDSSVSILVLDEVDCMMQRGFRDQVMQIFRALSSPQVLMYSATVSKDVENVADSIAKGFVRVSVGKPEKPSGAVRQVAIWVGQGGKKEKLFEILTSERHFDPPAVVFVGSRLGADLLCEAIRVKTGIKALSIHGEKTMKERREVLGSFLVGEVDVIVATGVLGRGVDLLCVRQVIVFDMPNSMAEYVHQIGRASRMGENGKAYVFVGEEDRRLFPELVEVLKSSGAEIPRELANSKYRVGSLSGGKGQKKRKHGH